MEKEKIEKVERSSLLEDGNEPNIQMTNTMIIDEIWEKMLPQDKMNDFENSPTLLFQQFE